MNNQWWKQAVIYQIYPRSFQDSNGGGIGDLTGIIKRLDYLSYLGIDALWLSPVYASPNDDNGYDISDYEAIGSEYGTMEDMDWLIEEADNEALKLLWIWSSTTPLMNIIGSKRYSKEKRILTMIFMSGENQLRVACRMD